MKPIQVYIDEEDAKKLKLIALEQDTTVAELLRSHVTSLINGQRPVRPSELGMSAEEYLKRTVPAPKKRMYYDEVSTFQPLPEPDAKKIEAAIKKAGGIIETSSTPPEKNKSVAPAVHKSATPRNICPQHLIDKDLCKMMKHGAV